LFLGRLETLKVSKVGSLIWASSLLTIALFIFFTMPISRANQDIITGTPGTHSDKAVVNFTELAQNRAQAPDTPTTPDITPYMPIPEGTPDPNSKSDPVSPSSPITADEPKPNSAVQTASFQALNDNNVSIPPDTYGAVGPNHLMTTLNSEFRIQNRSGTVLSTVSIESFFNPVGGLASKPFDPRVLYDPYSQRWVIVACDDRRSNQSSLVLAASQTNDPTGNWNLFRVQLGSATDWLDYPSMGFNKDWITINVNQFDFASTGNFTGTNTYAFKKADLYANVAATHTKLFSSSIGGTLVPTLTYDNTLNGMYLLQHFSGANGQIKLYALTGLIGSETLSLVSTINAPGGNTWSFSTSVDDFAPQSGTTRKIMTNDARMQSAVYRNGSVWGTQNAFLPATNPTRSAVQWWQLTTTGTVTQFGRIDDPNGQNFYAFPSIAVNSRGDAMVGYTRFSSAQFASANYTYRFANDPLNTMRQDTVLKAGEDPYNKDFGNGRNRWGDYSNTVVDPLNDIDMWTIQQYAATANPPGSSAANSGRWGTWWGKLTMPTTLSLVSGTPQTAPLNQNYTNPLRVLVRDSASNPLPGVTVNFSAVASPNGASVTFPGGSFAVTDATGQASINTTANNIPGAVTVLATVGGIATTINFSLTNIIVSTPGYLKLLPNAVRVAFANQSTGTRLVATGAVPTIGSTGTIQLTIGGTNDIPANATGVTGVLTSINCTGGGNLRFWTGGTAPDFNNLNIPNTSLSIPGVSTAVNISTGFVSQLDAQGKVYLGLGTAPGVICGYAVDVTGYFVPTSQTGNTITQLPNAVRVAFANATTGTRLTATGATPQLGDSSSITLTIGGANGIPADAVAVTGILTNIGCTGGGNLRFWTGATAPNFNNLNIPSTTLNIPGATATANLSTGFIATLDAQGKVNLGLGSAPGVTCGYAVDITGYIANAPATPANAVSLISPSYRVAFANQTGVRLIATGAVPVIGTSGVFQIDMKGILGLPTDAKGVLGILTNIGCTGGGNLRFWTGGTAPDFNNLNIPGITLNIPGVTTTFNLSTNFVAPIDANGKVYLGLGSASGVNCGYAVDIVGFLS
jgi:hypothetical protein